VTNILLKNRLTCSRYLFMSRWLLALDSSSSFLRRLAAFFLLFSLFGITARGQNFSAQIINYNLEIPSWQTATFLNNGTSGVNGAYFTNYGTVQANGNFQVGTYNWAVFNQNAGTFNVNDYLSIARNSGSGTIQVNGGWVMPGIVRSLSERTAMGL